MKKALVIVILTIVLLFLYGRYIEVKSFKTHEYTIKNENIPASFEDLKLVQFSDVLYEPETSEAILKKVTKKINDLDADIIIFSGDLFKKGLKYKEDDYTKIKKYLTDMEASLYKLAVIGENDEENIQEYKDILYESGFNLLDNQNMLLFYKDEEPINIIGITNLDADFNTLLTTDVPYNYSLAISHTPDNFDELIKHNINTVLSGHSLGGMVNIPFYGGLIKKEGAQKYLNNYYKNGNNELYISNGLGYEKFNFRLFNTPSINIYRFSK